MTIRPDQSGRISTEETAMPEYKVLSPINVGEGIQRDGMVTLAAKDADPLVAQGILAAIKAADAGKSAKGGKGK
ncbi:MAG: hypothetical protein Q8L45_01705 [Xanthomonadaceae bacterium]|nr:hypothetical protein [Xanthomonadaceae bacterium]MDP2185024.1 hypothetical protein [Xanthomonadales bacterium]MDZ4114403.1 hypothetical protein [Xanthomonadaceae bacterium]